MVEDYEVFTTNFQPREKSLWMDSDLFYLTFKLQEGNLSFYPSYSFSHKEEMEKF